MDQFSQPSMYNVSALYYLALSPNSYIWNSPLLLLLYENYETHNGNLGWLVRPRENTRLDEIGSLPFSVSFSLTPNLPLFIGTH